MFSWVERRGDLILPGTRDYTGFVLDARVMTEFGPSFLEGVFGTVGTWAGH